MSHEKLVNNLSGELPLKEAYTDLVQPSAKAIGQTISIIPRALNLALQPLQKWIAAKEANYAQTEKLIAEKLSDVTPDKIVTPDAYVAVPALQNLAYCMESSELRELYANLLSKAVQIDKKEAVHPAFVEVIRQLSPLDARTLSSFATAFSDTGVLPLCDIINPSDYTERTLRDMPPLKNFKIACCGRTNILSNIGLVDNANVPLPQISISISNLLRLGLIGIPEGMVYLPECYQNLDQNAELLALLMKYRKKFGSNVCLIAKSCQFTPFGKSFVTNCVY